MIACRARAILIPVRGEMVAMMPDCMGERALLRDKQQQNAQKAQDAALRQHRQ